MGLQLAEMSNVRIILIANYAVLSTPKSKKSHVTLNIL